MLRRATKRRLARVATAAFALGLFGATGQSALASPSTTSPEQGYDLGDIEAPRSLGMGGALAATGVSTVGLYLNPANMALAQVYHLEGIAAFSPEARRQSYSVGAVDSILNSGHLAGGLAGSFSSMDPDGIDRRWTDIRGGLAYPFGDRLSIGASVRSLRVQQATGVGPFGASYASDGTSGSPLFNQILFDIGATLSITEALRLGIVGKNLTNPGTSFAPTTLNAGLGYTVHQFTLEADGLADFTTWQSTKYRVAVGAELFVADHFAIRLGYRYDEGLKTNALSGGLGYVDQRWSIEGSVRRDVTGDNPSTMMSIALRYFVDTMGQSSAGQGPVGY
jgi:opacity protein-like surface antigen